SAPACAAGKVGTRCLGSDSARCDSTRGAGERVCDACSITGGESTENEMFILIGSYYVPAIGGATSGASREQPATTLDAAGRSLLTDPVPPPQVACSSSHTRHARPPPGAALPGGNFPSPPPPARAAP